MLRKIMLHGRSSHSITLPHEWIKKYNISKGDSLDVSTKGNKVIISTEKDIESEKKVISGEFKDISTRVISALYKSGYDEIKVLYPKERDYIKRFVTEELIGFETIAERDNSIVLRNVSVPNYDDFDRILKRSFHIIITAGEDLARASDNQDKFSLKDIERNDKELNRLTAFLLRALNKKEFSLVRKPTASYTMVIALEKIGDAYKEFSKAMERSWDPDAIAILEELNMYFKEIYELHYIFSLERYDEFQIKRDHFLGLIERYDGNDPKKSLYLYSIFNYIYDMKSQLLIEKL